MTIPTYEAIMLPALQKLADQQVHALKDLYISLTRYFSLTEEELQQMTPSGKSKLFYNRVCWGQTYLKKAGLILSPKSGQYQITDRGLSVLRNNPDRLNKKMLMQYPEFVDFWGAGAKPGGIKTGETDVIIDSLPEKTPQETMEDCNTSIRDALADELLQRISDQSPAFFERVVLDLLVQMGYGGSREDAAQVVGRSGDEGIDGIIKEDRLGLDVIYVQAKRWKNSVGSQDIQGFIGALQLKGANKGVFITTSSFTQPARDVAAKVGHRIVLLDGMQLARLMIEHDVGVSIETTYTIKRIDSDYFNGE